MWDLFFKNDTIHCMSNITGLHKIKLILLFIVHHLLSTFLIFGWIINSRIITILYLVSLVIVIGSWQIYDGLCYLTVMQNDMCGSNKKKPFNHFFQLMKIDENQKNKKYYYGILIIGITVSLYKLFT
jgi:hypothetical protein